MPEAGSDDRPDTAVLGKARSNNLRDTPNTPTEYAIAMGLAFLVIPVVEIVKLIRRMMSK